MCVFVALYKKVKENQSKGGEREGVILRGAGERGTGRKRVGKRVAEENDGKEIVSERGVMRGGMREGEERGRERERYKQVKIVNLIKRFE
jgi:hypothetical protein